MLKTLVVLLLCAMPTAVWAEDVLIEGVRVFDGERVIDRTSVLISNGKIRMIDPHLRPPKGVHVVDGKGCTLLPGLIDAHTHIHSRQDLEQSLVFGVTAGVLVDRSAWLRRIKVTNDNGAGDQSTAQH